MREEFAKNDIDFEKHEAHSHEDDFDKKERVVKVRRRKYFFMGGK